MSMIESSPKVMTQMLRMTPATSKGVPVFLPGSQAPPRKSDFVYLLLTPVTHDKTWPKLHHKSRRSLLPIQFLDYGIRWTVFTMCNAFISAAQWNPGPNCIDVTMERPEDNLLMHPRWETEKQKRIFRKLAKIRGVGSHDKLMEMCQWSRMPFSWREHSRKFRNILKRRELLYAKVLFAIDTMFVALQRRLFWLPRLA
jgi:hypothetical protein